MPTADLVSWIDDLSRPGIIWYAKRLAANDTLATNAHQAGPYVPREFLFQIFPSLYRPKSRNPDIEFDLFIDSHNDRRSVRGIWYNNALHGGTRNETRITRLGGRESALLDPENTGALAVFVFLPSGQSVECRVWVCSSAIEAELIEEHIGPVEPKRFVIWSVDSTFSLSVIRAPSTSNCCLEISEIPRKWLTVFPTGSEIIRFSLDRRPLAGATADQRLLSRRDCEFEVFQSVESAFHMPRINAGFRDISDFLKTAQSVLQSRKSRSGRSLELHTKEIMLEEGMTSDVKFSHGATIEGGKKPDFIFPSAAAYNNLSFPNANLRMLAAKTTCKDRWRQILNEADRIQIKHLLTLQEGVSENQFNEMTQAGVKLVVPIRLHRAYPVSVRPHLISLQSFIDEVKRLA